MLWDLGSQQAAGPTKTKLLMGDRFGKGFSEGLLFLTESLKKHDA